MIAIVSSAIQPFLKNEQKVSFYTFEERLVQTKFTLTRLRECGFDSIFLVDNSPLLDQLQLQNLLQDFPEVKVYHLQQFQFKNKGVNELLMLLFLIQHLPSDQNIFKISGRYYPNEHFKKPDFVDFAVKRYHHQRNNNSVSTRGYWVKNAETLHRFLLSCVYEHFAYAERIVGIRSLVRVLFGNKGAINEYFSISIEFAADHVLKAGNYQVRFLEKLGIEGLIAGADQMEKIIE